MAFRIPRLKLDPKGIWPIVIRLFRETGRKHWKGYGVALFFMALVAATTAASAWLVSDVVNSVFVDRDQNQLLFIAAVVVVVSLLRGISLYGSQVTLSYVGNNITAEMQRRLYEHLLQLGMNFYDKTHSSQLIMRITMAASAVSEVLNTVLTSFGRDLLSVIGLGIVMFLQSPTLSLVTLVIAPIAIFGIQRLVKQMRAMAGLELQGNAAIISGMQETAAGIRIVKAFSLEPIMQTRVSGAIEDVREKRNRVARVKALTLPLMETLGGFAVAGVMLFAGFVTIGSDQTPGAFISFLTAVLFAYEPAKRLASTRVGLERGIVGARMIFRLLDTQVTMSWNPDGPELKVEKGEIVLRKVDFGYRKNRKVFTRFDFRAAPGTVTALVGPSGGGKSTIMSLIERYYDVNDGEVLIDGQDISKVRLASLRNAIAFVSQDTVIFRASVADNIRFGRPSATDEEVEEAARNALAHDFIAELKDGYETMLDDGGIKLSGGQLQRIAIARAMLRDAPIILLDEATSALDSESEHLVQTAFERLMKGRTTVVIAHRLSTVLGADRICVLVDGRIVESGRHGELLAAGNHYARLYRLQFARSAEDHEPVEPRIASVG